MFDKKGNLTSIPEYNESDDDIVKWVPKKKHEILKAKYKCLKKLFQIYDASVIGILPHDVPNYEEQKETEIRYRRKRSHRTKTDACAGTTEISSGDVSLTTERTAATAVMEDLNLQTYALIDTSRTTLSNAIDKSDKGTQDSKEDLTNNKESECVQTSEPSPFSYVVINERRKPTRFQNFLNRIFGFKTEKRYSYPQTGVYAASDTNILNGYERRRRRALRFRRRRPKKIHSEIILRDVNTPMIMSYVQSVQKHCLMDKTPRQCPIVGCRMIFYGIINYNDHLNLYHFLDRKYICLYCHEGFTIENDKVVHENEHIGISKIVTPTVRQSAKIASNTQTEPENSGIDVPEEKLKKIVSFFDKISDCDRVIDQIKKHRYSESNLDTTNPSTKSETDDAKSVDFRKRSDDNVKERRRYSSADSVSSNFPSQRFTCRFCGENFDFRRQLNLHMDLEHRVHDKFSKFHSCPGIVNRKAGLSEGRINIRSEVVTSPSTCTEVSSDRSVTCDPSTNIVYYTSMESVMKKPSVVESLVQKIRSYKWEPGSKIIRV